ncbi:lytic polysaccharide monooxygenase [Serratia plymuthica]|uniref:lytic polysaccharide monooxygenase n=1 Tax=Serratia plymuthica TaxID=82996 RepID=UPI001F532385|nr:lytic polysaccharide monooxygenase [Serratia plymuthica]UNK25958.1 lytic polysaccharide monooxygenase [Serratia plymuthica]
MANARRNQPRHGHVFSPESRAIFAYQEGKLTDTDPSSLEAGKFFPATAGGLHDPLAPTDDLSNVPAADGKIASGGWPGALFLDEPGTQWRKHEVKAGQPLTVSWAYHALHLTRRWNYFITKADWDPQRKLARDQFESTPFYKAELSAQPHWEHQAALTPPEPTIHQLTLPERHGYHVLLAIWEVANTGNAFYQVIDLNFTDAGGNERPTPPGGLHATHVTTNSLELAWSASHGAHPITRYSVFCNGDLLVTLDASTLGYTHKNLAPDTDYTYFVSATDSENNQSLPGNSIVVRTLNEGGEDNPPTAPGNLHSMGVTADTVRLMWSASTGGHALKHYYVYRDGIQVGTTSPTQHEYTDAGLSGSTEYRYFVAAIDVRDYLSLPSNVLILSTSGGGNIPEWALNTRYEVDDKVRYQGKTYQCLQAHISNEGWNPAETVTILWKEISALAR